MERCLLGKGLAILALDLDHLDILEGIPGLGRSHIRRGGARQEKVAEDDHRIVAHQCQEEVFQEISDSVGTIMEGHTVTVVAYGQTSSGKTFVSVFKNSISRCILFNTSVRNSIFYVFGCALMTI